MATPSTTPPSITANYYHAEQGPTAPPGVTGNYYHAYAYTPLGDLAWDYVLRATWVGAAIEELNRTHPTEGLDIMILDPQGNIRGRVDNRPNLA